MDKAGSILLLMVVMLSGCSFFEKKDNRIPRGRGRCESAKYRSCWLKICIVPWSIDMVNQAFYISERTGSIVKIENGKIERQPVDLEKPLAQGG